MDAFTYIASIVSAAMEEEDDVYIDKDSGGKSGHFWCVIAWNAPFLIVFSSIAVGPFFFSVTGLKHFPNTLLLPFRNALGDTGIIDIFTTNTQHWNSPLFVFYLCSFIPFFFCWWSWNYLNLYAKDYSFFFYDHVLNGRAIYQLYTIGYDFNGCAINFNLYTKYTDMYMYYYSVTTFSTCFPSRFLSLKRGDLILGLKVPDMSRDASVRNILSFICMCDSAVVFYFFLQVSGFVNSIISYIEIESILLSFTPHIY